MTTTMSASLLDVLPRPAAAPAAPGGLLVWVGNNQHAESLVRHARQLADAGGLPWTVLCVETPSSLQLPAEQRAHALRALALAERLGAATDSVSAGSVVGAVVERVRQEQASMVIIGAHPPDGWLEGEQRHWLGGLADALSGQLPEATINVIHYPAEAVRAPARADPPAAAGLPLRRDWLLALAVVLLCTLVSDTMHIEPASAATVYLAGVVYVALRLGQSAAVVAVLSSILLFDLMFIEPRWSMTPIDPKYYFTFLVMLVVGLLISRLAANARLQAFVADARARRTQALNELASRLVVAKSEDDISGALGEAVRSTFGVSSTLLLPDGSGTLRDAAGFRAGSDADLQAAQALYDAGEAPSSDAQVGAGGRPVLLQGTRAPLGVLLTRPLPARFGTPEDRRLLDALANLAALALERSQLEHKSRAAAIDAETERLRSTLLTGISHDFRTPLTTIVGAASSLLQQDLAIDPPRRKLLLESVLAEAQRLHALMSDLLDLMRMEEGSVQPSCEWCPADELVGAARAALGGRLASHRVRVQPCADTLVWCDARLLEQALVNLLDNAVRYTAAGSTIDVRIEAGAAQCRVVVADDGPGLPAGKERDVFLKFFRGRSEPTDGGTGMGLAICAAVARLHGGRIDAHSDGGACFTLTLPQPVAPRVSEAA